MNYKNNLLSKKKYKIVNQKAGAVIKWTLSIRLPDNPKNVEKNFDPFEITILQDSGKSGGYLGFGYWYGLERVVNGVSHIAEFKKNENDFIESLYNYSNKLHTYTPDDLQIKEKLDLLQLTPDMLRFIAATIAFPPCYPKNFYTLHETAKKILIEKYNKAKKRCTQRTGDNQIRRSHCGLTIGWMINFEDNIKSTTNINVCK